MPCDRHVGEAFPPRCTACDRQDTHTPEPVTHLAHRLGFQPGTDCPEHPGYPQGPDGPCDKCIRDSRPTPPIRANR